MNIGLAPEPDNDRRHAHQNTGDAEGDARSLVLKQPGNEQRRKRGADIHREIKPTENPREQMLVAGRELVADKGGDARFDPARAQRDEKESSRQAPTRVVKRENPVSHTVKKR